MVGLRLQRADHGRVVVAEAGDRGATAGIEIAASFAVDQVNALAIDGVRQLAPGMAMEEMIHGAIPLSVLTAVPVDRVAPDA